MHLLPATFDRLLHLLNAGHELTQTQISDRLGVSDRQARRLIEKMRNQGIEVREKRSGRYKIYYLDPEDREVSPGEAMHFEERELFALLIAAQAARSTLESTPLNDPLKAAYKKLVNAISDSVLTFEPELQHTHWFFESTAHSNIDADVFEAITEAINQSRCVYIDYFSASQNAVFKKRKIDPYVVAVRGSSWLLVAFSHHDNTIVDYSIAGISRVELTDQFFSRNSGFDPDIHFRDRFSALKGRDDYVVRLHVERAKVPYFQRKSYHPTQMFEEEYEDGSVVVSYEVSGLDEIAAFIRSWGPGVRVLEPEELAKRIGEEAAAVAGYYTDVQLEMEEKFE